MEEKKEEQTELTPDQIKEMTDSVIHYREEILKRVHMLEAVKEAMLKKEDPATLTRGRIVSIKEKGETIFQVLYLAEDNCFSLEMKTESFPDYILEYLNLDENNKGPYIRIVFQEGTTEQQAEKCAFFIEWAATAKEVEFDWLGD